MYCYLFFFVLNKTACWWILSLIEFYAYTLLYIHFTAWLLYDILCQKWRNIEIFKNSKCSIDLSTNQSTSYYIFCVFFFFSRHYWLGMGDRLLSPWLLIPWLIVSPDYHQQWQWHSHAWLSLLTMFADALFSCITRLSAAIAITSLITMSADALVSCIFRLAAAMAMT